MTIVAVENNLDGVQQLGHLLDIIDYQSLSAAMLDKASRIISCRTADVIVVHGVSP